MSRRRRWTDDQLRAAVVSATGFVEVQEKLGLHRGGAGYWNVKQRIEELGIDISHFTRADHVALLENDDDVRAAVAASTTFMMVLSALGLTAAHGAYQKVRRRIRHLELDTSHFVRAWSTSRKKRTSWTDDDLRRAVASSRSFAQAIRALGLVPEGGNYRHVRRRIDELGLDTSHMTGQGWNVGRQFAPRPAVPLSEVLVANRWASSDLLKKPECELCGWAQISADGRIPVELDHINGDHTDNRLENLRILCPNCHALTPTYRGRNQKRRKAVAD